MTDVIHCKELELLGSSLPYKMIKSACSQRIEKLQKGSGGYAYRRVPMDITALREKDAIKEKHQMLLESMKKQFNTEEKINEIKKNSSVAKARKSIKRQSISQKCCESNSCDLEMESPEVDKSERRGKHERKSDVVLDCYVKIIPMDFVPRTRKEHQLVQTQQTSGDSSHHVMHSKGIDTPDPPPKISKISGGNTHCTFSQADNTSITANDKKTKNQKIVESMKEQFNKEISKAQTVTREETKHKTSKGKSLNIVEQTGLATDEVHNPPPKIHKTSGGHIYRRWPQTIGTSITMNDLKAKHQKILESMREQFNLETPKQQLSAGEEMGKLNIEKRKSQVNTTERKSHNNNNNYNSGRQVHPHSKSGTKDADNNCVNRLTAVKQTNKRKTKSSSDVKVKSRKSEQTSLQQTVNQEVT